MGTALARSTDTWNVTTRRRPEPAHEEAGCGGGAIRACPAARWRVRTKGTLRRATARTQCSVSPGMWGSPSWPRSRSLRGLSLCLPPVLLDLVSCGTERRIDRYLVLSHLDSVGSQQVPQEMSDDGVDVSNQPDSLTDSSHELLSKALKCITHPIGDREREQAVCKTEAAQPG